MLFCVLWVNPLFASSLITFSTHLEPKSRAFKSTRLLLHEAFRRLGYNFTLVSLPGKRSLIQANNGLFDGEAHRIGTLHKFGNYPDLIKVPESLLVVTNSIFTIHAPVSANSWESLSGYTIAVPRGSLWITQKAKKYAKEIQELATAREVLMFVKSGRADIGVIATEYSELIEKDEFKSFGLKRLGPELLAIPIYTFVHKKHKTLVHKIAQTLRHMKRDGSYQLLLNQSET